MERLHSTVDVEGRHKGHVSSLYLQGDTDRGNSQKEERSSITCVGVGATSEHSSTPGTLEEPWEDEPEINSPLDHRRIRRRRPAASPPSQKPALSRNKSAGQRESRQLGLARLGSLLETLIRRGDHHICLRPAKPPPALSVDAQSASEEGEGATLWWKNVADTTVAEADTSVTDDVGVRCLSMKPPMPLSCRPRQSDPAGAVATGSSNAADGGGTQVVRGAERPYGLPKTSHSQSFFSSG
ncbi:unnamed protein product [Rangifer tarandus platyrhynchus]|uniref:Uncharacterized protein n=1 Tax=Rangifer tarandus platyrhynchus TaxID=3082113 RepID=A0AC59ZDN4_RANTA